MSAATPFAVEHFEVQVPAGATAEQVRATVLRPDMQAPKLAGLNAVVFTADMLAAKWNRAQVQAEVERQSGYTIAKLVDDCVEIELARRCIEKPEDKEMFNRYALMRAPHFKHPTDKARTDEEIKLHLIVHCEENWGNLLKGMKEGTYDLKDMLTSKTHLIAQMRKMVQRYLDYVSASAPE